MSQYKLTYYAKKPFKILKFVYFSSLDFLTSPNEHTVVSVNQAEENRIDYEFYEKPTKNPRVLLADSAINSASKRTILTQECIRRLRNTKVELGEDCQNKHLSNFMLKLKNSGYNRKFRVEILDSALKGFKKMLEEDREGTKPLYRDRNLRSFMRRL